MEEFVAAYGYLAVFVGTFLEGETVLVLGGFLAHRGYLNLAGVILAAFLGTFAGDQLFYYLGRIKGTGIIDQRAGWREKTERVFRLLHRHQLGVILGFRFIYGLRTVTPFVIGASGMHPLRFLALNAIGAALWAMTIGLLGYSLGRVLTLLLGEVRRYELSILVIIALSGAVAWLVYWRREATRVGRGRPPRPRG